MGAQNGPDAGKMQNAKKTRRNPPPSFFVSSRTTGEAGWERGGELSGEGR